MNEANQQTPEKGGLETLQEIKQMMERSSRFISLSGISGIAAGICALIGAWMANSELEKNGLGFGSATGTKYLNSAGFDPLRTKLLVIGGITFIAAFVLAFIFTYLRSKKAGTPIWGMTARRVMVNVAIPMVAGGLFLLPTMLSGNYEYVASGSLIFYGLALVNASKYTLHEIRYLGYCEIILGLINCWIPEHGLIFWAAGFGVLHIIYGAVMWFKYER
jgi:hypothetical protein